MEDSDRYFSEYYHAISLTRNRAIRQNKPQQKSGTGDSRL